MSYIDFIVSTLGLRGHEQARSRTWQAIPPLIARINGNTSAAQGEGRVFSNREKGRVLVFEQAPGW